MKIYITIFLSLFISSCTVSTPKVVDIQNKQLEQPKEERILKRKVAIAKFGNEAEYGKSALFGLNTNYNAQTQATDILSAKLAESKKFILLEKKILDKENSDTNNTKPTKLEADYLLYGSVSEFGRKNVSNIGLLSRTKTQIAYAKVNIRIVDISTGEVIFAQEGNGEAQSDAETSFGFGQQVSYDSSLNDKAISTAISAVVDGIVNNMLNKPWKTYILSKENNDYIIIAGGKTQGIKIGDEFSVVQKKEFVTNPQTGIKVELPPTKIATIVVSSQYGNSYNDEVSICRLQEGSIPTDLIKEVYVQK